MKAKHFTKIRSKVKYYDVVHTDMLFSSFSDKFEITVLAYNHQHACDRAKKRGYGIKFSSYEQKKSEQWARWKIKLTEKPNNFRYIKYYG